ncbi:MAG: hypothetical protein DRQ98_10495 [Gammaproteobacteria bacterium]|nr:MAG: hypothetical protein DRQ98_10495 [Gammaproteobacteria bacterium]
MNELKRMAYLDAMGIDAYVSRGQLAGAAVTRRLIVVPARVTVPATQSRLPVADGTVAAGDPVPEATGRVAQIDNVEKSPAPPKIAAPASRQGAVSQFNLVAITAGGWLWLEEMGGMPLATEQVQLVQAMVQALDVVGQTRPLKMRPEVAHFEWPIHTNAQLDLGEEAARASVAGFIGRKLEQQQCRGLVLLGEACKARVQLAQLDCPLVASTVSSAEMLGNPLLKKQAWRDLLPLIAL